MLVTVAVGVTLSGVGAVMFMARRRRRDTRARILRLAGDIDAVAASIEADFVKQPAARALQRLSSQAQDIAQRARGTLQRKFLLVALPGCCLRAEENRLHQDHGAIVHLRSRADSFFDA